MTLPSDTLPGDGVRVALLREHCHSHDLRGQHLRVWPALPGELRRRAGAGLVPLCLRASSERSRRAGRPPAAPFGRLRAGLSRAVRVLNNGGTPCPRCRRAVPPQGGRGVAELRYKAWGETRYTWGTTPHRLQVHRAAAGRKHGIVLLWGALLRPRAGAVHRAGHGRAGAGRSAVHEYRTNPRITRRAICGRPPQPAARVRQATATEVTRTIGPHYEVVVSVASGQVLTTAG